MADGFEDARGSASAGLIGLVRSRQALVEGLVLAGAILIFLASVLPNLGSYPAVTDDEMWVFSSAYKLAQDGVFGSDMFAGFFHADTRYYFNMPLHHLLIAGVFKLLEAGIAQARLVGVAYGIATLLLTYLLARRLYGVAVAVLSVTLLLFLRLNMGFDTGLPLQELSVSMRYDLAPVPLVLAGCIVLLGRASFSRAALAGAFFGLATLMQFYGAFILPVAIAFLWLEHLSAKERLRLVGGLVAASAVVCLPYGVYALAHLDDFRGQAGTIDHRADFASPRFYIHNLRHEPDRFVRPLGIPYAFTEVSAGQDPLLTEPHRVGIRAIVRRPSAKLGVIAGLPLALGYFGLRYRAERRRGDLLLLLSLGGLVIEYALFDSTKFYYYWIPVVPFLCIGIAGAVLALLRLPRAGLVQRLAVTVTVSALLFVFAEGSVARLNGWRTAYDAASYDGLAAELHGSVPADSRVVGSTSLWWALHDTDYRSYFLFFYLTRPDAGTYRTTIPAFLDRFRPDYIVLTRLADAELQKHLSPHDYQDWQSYLAARGHKVTRLDGPSARSYTYIDVWKID